MRDKKKIIYSAIGLIVLALFSGCAGKIANLPDEYERLSAKYEKDLSKDPTNQDLRLETAEFYYSFRDYDRVEAVLKEVREKKARIILAKAYTAKKEYTEALEIYEQLGKLDDSEYMFSYASSLEAKNLYPKAIEIYKQVKAPFKTQAKARLKKIGLKIEEGLPDNIKDILISQKEFLAAIEDEEAVYLSVDEEIEIYKDNTSQYRGHLIKQVLKEQGKSIGEVEIGYDSTDEKVELIHARTITKEGKIVYVGKENTRDVSKYLNFPLYSNARAYIVSMPSVDIGAIIDYKVEVSSSALVNDDDFTYVYHLRERFPVAKAKFKLIVPKGRQVNLKFLNTDYAQGLALEPKKETVKGKDIYTWNFNHIKPIIPEDKMPPQAFVNPAIAISSFGSWEEIYSWWREQFEDKIELSPQIKKFTDDLIKDCKDDRCKAKEIYEFASRNIRYVGVEYGESGHEPHKASDIFWNRYGDCKDKATLLVAMMRYAGLKAYPVLIPTRSVYSISPDFPAINFNHAIALVDLGPDYLSISQESNLIFMDPTSSTSSFEDLPLDDQDRYVLVFFKDNHKVLKTPLIKNNDMEYNTHVVIDENEDAKVNRMVVGRGFFSAWQRYYLKYTHPQQIQENIRSKMVSISSFSKLLDYKVEDLEDFDKPPVLRYEFESSKLLNPAGKLRMLPFMGDVGMDTALIAKSKRNFPLDFRGIYKNTSKVTVVLPKNLKVNYLPANIERTSLWFDFSAKYTQDKNNLEIRRQINIKKLIIEPKEYQEFKKFLEEILYLLREELILEKK